MYRTHKFNRFGGGCGAVAHVLGSCCLTFVGFDFLLDRFDGWFIVFDLFVDLTDVKLTFQDACSHRVAIVVVIVGDGTFARVGVVIEISTSVRPGFAVPGFATVLPILVRAMVSVIITCNGGVSVGVRWVVHGRDWWLTNWGRDWSGLGF